MLTGDTLSPILYGMTNAITYLRVSGADQNRGDGFERQRVACAAHAASAGMEVVGEYIETVSGTHDGLDRPVFAAMLERIAGNGVRVVLIERADRLARDLMVSEALLCQLRNLGVKVIESCSGLDLTDASDPSRIMIRQMLGAVAEFNKRELVGKLAKARRRIRDSGKRCDGRKPFGARAGEVETLVSMEMMRDEGMSLRQIAGQLEVNESPSRSGKPWTAEAVRVILKRAS
jgi:DNA invertase Pin-like site-specific DNA recombinase